MREKRATMKLRLAAGLALLMASAVLWAGDTSALRPPSGATVALVAFEDLQCPDCADAEALLQDAASKYEIPLVRRDFPLPMHNWSFEAHVIARYFDTQTETKPVRRTDGRTVIQTVTEVDTEDGAQNVSREDAQDDLQTGTQADAQNDTQTDSQTDAQIYTVTTLTNVKAEAATRAKGKAKALPLGEQFRRWVYANQSSINKGNLRGMAERFADQHNLELPANYDPKGELKKLVLADYALAQQVGVIHTPTVFVVSVSQRGSPFVEVVDRAKLFAMIEQMQVVAKKQAGRSTE
jgi:protein-disulfide isomerase